MVSKGERRRALARRRKKRGKGDVEWTLTNIGAVISMMGLMLVVFIGFNWFLTGYVLTILFIPSLALFIIGYVFIVKDYLDNKGKKTEKAIVRKVGSEEE